MESTVRMLLTNYKFRDLAISLEKKYSKVRVRLDRAFLPRV
jgi:hypothetical protein